MGKTTKYAATNFAIPSIEKVSLTDGFEQSAIGKLASFEYFDTFDEAKNYLLSIAEIQVKNAEKLLADTISEKDRIASFQL